ncbi:MAG: branched-chain amino acid ABC transporter permease [Thermoleophilia bacterium]|nr:branched-chain amino acid ABC transporter permease [Thermoleophilia bacterium]
MTEATAVLAAFDPQVLVDAFGRGAVYALMAVGIGLVFGVLRLVNFAYGQLIMAGAYALAFAYERDWPTWLGIVLCFGVVIALSIAMDQLVFRRLRLSSPAVMLVATFAVAFLLQAVALLLDARDDTLGEPAASLSTLNQPIVAWGLDIRKISLLAIVVAVACLVALGALLARTEMGLHMRAAAMDFTTAQMLGVRADRVIGTAVVLSGVLAATVAVILTVQAPLVSSTFALRETIIVLAGVVLGGIDRLGTATLGGFAIGVAEGLLGGLLPTEASVFLPAFLFGVVIIVLLVRPAGLFARGRSPGGVARV